MTVVFLHLSLDEVGYAAFRYGAFWNLVAGKSNTPRLIRILYIVRCMQMRKDTSFDLSINTRGFRSTVGRPRG